MSFARSLVPTPSSARFVPFSPCRSEQLDEALARARPRRPEPAAGDGERHRLVGHADRRERAGDDDPALAVERRDEALAARQVPEHAGLGQDPVVGQPLAATQIEGEVGAARAAHVRLAGVGEQLGDLL